MAFILICGNKTFTSKLAGYENVTVQCQNCGNFSAHVYKRWQWFTVCFIPLIPFSFKPDHDVGCHVCNFYQDLRHRPDVEAARTNAQQQIPMQNYGGGGGPRPGGPGGVSQGLPGSGPGHAAYK